MTLLTPGLSQGLTAYLLTHFSMMENP